jgi:hypothetical protein
MKQLLFLFLTFTIIASAQKGSIENQAANNDEKIYRSTEVDLKPQLKDGLYTLSMFISDNFKFPADFKNKKIKIFASFVVETDGTMTDVKAFYISVKDYLATDVVKIATQDEKQHEADQTESMKTETVRVLSIFKKTWNPALKDLKPVRCLYNYPLNFNIE